MKTNTKKHINTSAQSVGKYPHKSALNEKGSKFNIVLIIVATFFIILVFVSVLLFPAFFGIFTGEEKVITPVVGTGGGNLADADALTLEQIQCILTKENANQEITAQIVYDAAHEFNVNPLWFLGKINHESQIGNSRLGRDCKNAGGIQYTTMFENIGISTTRCRKRWSGFANYKDSIRANMYLIRVSYLDKEAELINNFQNLRNKCPVFNTTVNNGLAEGKITINDLFLVAIITKYAPPCVMCPGVYPGCADNNDPVSYAASVLSFMAKYQNCK